MRKLLLNILCLVLVGLLISPTSSAPGFDDWEDGDEVEIFGHSFDEEYWTASVSNETEKESTWNYSDGSGLKYSHLMRERH